MCFFCPFSILITLLGEEGAGLCAYRAFVCLFVICGSFSLPPGVVGLAAASACDSSWTFLFTFFQYLGWFSWCTDKRPYGHLPSHEKWHERTFALQTIDRGGRLPPE